MRKRTRITEPIKEEFGWEDYASALPDPILVSILSRLTLKEAVATSILSRRWRYLWTHVTDLKFDANDTLNNRVYDDKLMTSERSRYINWVNRVLRQHRGPVVDGVRICFNFNKSSKSAVDNWVKFAIVKRVQRLELDLYLHVGLNNYTFPYKLLSRSNGMSLKNVCSNYGLIQPGMPSRLEVLKLKSVNVSEEALDHIFSNCPVLNNLSIHNSGNLKNVKVSGLTLRLKYLEIVSCDEVKSIEISNVNLVSFAYFGRRIKLIVCNVPMLGEISFGERYYGYGPEKNVFEQLSCCLHQLEIVTLDIREDNRMVSAFPVLPNLKLLILKVGSLNYESLLKFTSLITACPNLYRFVLQLPWRSPSRKRKVSHGAECMHAHLKSVEIVGYNGRRSDAEAVMYIIENTIALETIVIDPHYQRLQRSFVGIDQIENEESARIRAKKQLESKIPPGVLRVIL